MPRPLCRKIAISFIDTLQNFGELSSVTIACRVAGLSGGSRIARNHPYFSSARDPSSLYSTESLPPLSIDCSISPNSLNNRLTQGE